MLTATWNWLWEKHDQTKDMFHFFVKPKKATATSMATGKSIDPIRKDNNGNNNRSYKPI